MFGASFVQNLSDAQKAALPGEIETHARPKLFQSDKWVMDYRRLRIVAHKI